MISEALSALLAIAGFALLACVAGAISEWLLLKAGGVGED